MLADIPLEETPDFEYVFEDVVRLQEFNLYHMGLGMYRFERPVIYNEDDFHCLEKEIPTFQFLLHTGEKRNQVTVCHVSSV